MRGGPAALVALLAGAPAVLLAAPAHAEERLLQVDAAAWSWRRTLPADSPAGSPVAEPSNVPAGGLAVAFDGRPDAPPAKATYLRLALGDLPAGTTTTGLRLVLPLDPSVEQDASAAPLVACRPLRPFVAGEGVDPARQPAEDCRGAARGQYDPVARTVSFSLTTAAVEWLGGAPNTGVVVRPDPAATLPGVLPFQLVFKGPASVVARLDVTLPPAGAPTQVPTAGPVAPLPEPQAGVPLLPGVGVQPPPASGAPAVPSPVAVPSVAPVPQAVPLPPRRPALAAARASDAGFATAAALGALLLALVSLASGEAASPRAFARSERRRLDRVRRVVPADQVDQADQLGQADLALDEQSRQGRRPVASAASRLTTS